MADPDQHGRQRPEGSVICAARLHSCHGQPFHPVWIEYAGRVGHQSFW